MTLRDPTRRHVLQLAAGSALACLRPLGGCADPLSGTYDAGNLADLPAGGALLVPDAPLAVFRDADGLWAMTTICSHLDCDMSEQGTVAADGLVCDCHGSRFDGDGAVVLGPATRSLDNYRVDLDAATGALTIDADERVDAGFRTGV